MSLTTKELIDDSLAKKNAKVGTETALATAQTDDANAAIAVATADQAVHDDLSANGQALYVTGDAPPVYEIAAPVDPGTYSLTPIRLA